MEASESILTKGLGTNIETLLPKPVPDSMKGKGIAYFKRFYKYKETFEKLYDSLGPGIFMPGTKTYMPLNDCMQYHDYLSEKEELEPSQKLDMMILKHLKNNEQDLSSVFSETKKTAKYEIAPYNAHLVENDPEKIVQLTPNEFKGMSSRMFPKKPDLAERLGINPEEKQEFESFQQDLASVRGLVNSYEIKTVKAKE